jgi:hypothetical protein
MIPFLLSRGPTAIRFAPPSDPSPQLRTSELRTSKLCKSGNPSERRNSSSVAPARSCDRLSRSATLGHVPRWYRLRTSEVRNNTRQPPLKAAARPRPRWTGLRPGSIWQSPATAGPETTFLP